MKKIDHMLEVRCESGRLALNVGSAEVWLSRSQVDVLRNLLSRAASKHMHEPRDGVKYAEPMVARMTAPASMAQLVAECEDQQAGNWSDA